MASSKETININGQKKKVKRTEPKVTSINKNNIKIIGENVLYNNGIITAFYIIPLVNYSTASYGGVESSIQDLVDMITNLCVSNPETTFTIEKIEKVIKKEDVLRNLVETIKIYRPDYTMPKEFTDNVKDDVQDYCLIGIDIQQTTIENIDDYSILDTAKSLFKQAANAFAGLGNMNADPEKILKLEENVYRTIKYKCVRASKDLVFYNYVSKLFPNYEISYNSMDYINENHYEDIMGAVTQTISDNFGSFELHNEGVDLFGQVPETTYGCMLDIKSFPIRIDNVAFPIDYPYTVTTVKCMKKENASIQVKRIRAADKYERDQAIEAGAELEQIESTQTNIDIATQAIEDIDNGKIMCQFNTSILVFAEDLSELRQRTADIINSCKDRDILASKSLTQALDFLEKYVNRKPGKFHHMASIDFPLSFQQNSGATVGDTDGMIGPNGMPIWSPAIGEDL